MEAAVTVHRTVAPDMFLRREAMLFTNYDYTLVSEEKEITIGLSRTLEFWESMPFWTTFFHALGFQTKYSHESCRSMYEKGISYILSDTVCFPAQMVIGEVLAVLQSGKYPRDRVAVGMAKYQGDCRLSHYSALLRHALDTAGFSDIPIMSIFRYRHLIWNRIPALQMWKTVCKC